MEKNKFIDKKVCLIIQGPTKFYSLIVPYLIELNENIKVIWSTWDNESADDILSIMNLNIVVILNKMPQNKGIWNCNLQCVSTYAAVCAAEKIDYFDLVIKIRSDFIIFNINKFIASSKICFFSQDKSLISLGYSTHAGGHVLDYIVGGSIESMKKFWRPSENENCGSPFPERYLETRYFDYQMEKIYNKNRVGYIDITNIKIKWIKNNVNVKFISAKIILNYKSFIFVKIYLLTSDVLGAFKKRFLIIKNLL
jgi:hypothetical protein